MYSYHWLPKDIAEIPYNKLKEMFMILEQKEAYRETKSSQDRIKSQINNMPKPGQGPRKFIREV